MGRIHHTAPILCLPFGIGNDETIPSTIYRKLEKDSAQLKHSMNKVIGV